MHFQETGWKARLLNFSGTGQGQVTDCCVNCYEMSGSIKGWESTDQSKNQKLMKKDCVLCCCLDIIQRYFSSVFYKTKRLLLKIIMELYSVRVCRVAQSVQRLATGWTIRGQNPGGDGIFRTRPDRPWGPPSLLCNGYRVFPGGRKRPGRNADPSPPSSAVVMKGQSYISTPPYGPYDLYRASVPVQGCTLPLPYLILYELKHCLKEKLWRQQPYKKHTAQ